MSGKVAGPEYDTEFRKLYHHFNMCKNSMQNFKGIDAFFKEYQLEYCQTAKQRVITGKGGYQGEESSASMAVRVFDITQRMINASDLMEMGHQEVDQLLPAIIDI